MMGDENPMIRCIGVEGTCKILTLYWEIIPLEKTYAFIKHISKKMAFDASSNAVRISCLKGLAYLSENHLSHASLKSRLFNNTC